MYTIEIYYQTGDSFHSEELTESIEYEWTNVEIVKKNLTRIKNHYEFYEEHSDMYTKPDAILREGVIWDNEFRSIGLELLDDDNKPFRYSAFWVGYFETLYTAEIINSNSDYKISFT